MDVADECAFVKLFEEEMVDEADEGLEEDEDEEHDADDRVGVVEHAIGWCAADKL